MTALARKKGSEDRLSERRCIVTGETSPKGGLLRFVLSPDGQIVADLAERLPGRGFWVSANAGAIREAVTKGRFARAARKPVAVDDNLATHVSELLAKKCRDIVGLARRSDRLVVGYDRVLEALARNTVGLVVVASDAGGGRHDVEAAASGLPVARALTNAELSAAVGKGTVSFLAILRGGLAESLLRENERLVGFRPEVSPDELDVKS